MSEIQIIKMAIDLALVGALLFLSFRFSRNGTSGVSARMAGLESSLRMLVEDADNAGQALNEKLLKRKTSLEKLLFDLETVEQRVGRTISSADGVRSELESEISRAKEYRTNLLPAAVRGAQDQTDRAADREDREAFINARVAAAEKMAALEPEIIVTKAAENAADAEGPALNFRADPRNKPAVKPAAAQAKPAAKAADPIEADLPELAELTEELSAEQPAGGAAAAAKPKLNIYGEPISAVESRPAPVKAASKKNPLRGGYKSLAQSVEKERGARADHAAVENDSASNSEMQRVYDAAEGLLKAGQDMKTVAAQTQLPLEEIKMLAQMVRLEGEALPQRNPAPGDGRLGVLGQITRRTQVL